MWCGLNNFYRTMYAVWCILLFKDYVSLNSVVLLRTRSRFLFRKGVMEVIFYLDKVGKAGYYEIYRQNFVVSRQTFANLLKELEKKGIVSRKVIEARPPRVEYSLTGKGKEIVMILNELNSLI